jgi:hypothetical protein
MIVFKNPLAALDFLRSNTPKIMLKNFHQELRFIVSTDDIHSWDEETEPLSSR